MTTQLDFSLGPVQGFVAQSRRTRDLWGSSYLLSFLSAHAMVAARAARGVIVRPQIDIERDTLLRWVTGATDGDTPRIGSVPNHFVVHAEDEAHATELAHAAEAAIRHAWARICNVVWRRYLDPVASLGDGTRTVWTRQIDNFWEIAWIVGSVEERDLLRRRKHWRSHRPPDEPGDKCTVMLNLQELSGHTRSHSATTRAAQDAFWELLRDALGSLEIRPQERLSAIAFVKRIYPRIADEALGWPVDTSHWPSTVYVGALPWIRDAAERAPDAARAFADAVIRIAPRDVLAERRPTLAGPAAAPAGELARLDANFFHASFLRDRRVCPLAPDVPDQQRDHLVELLRSVCSGAGGAPPIYGALLLADGDRLGALVTRVGGQLVGRALTAFTASVPDIVRRHDGVTVYAGGDDVLAMLPVPRALAAAAALAACYTEQFAAAGLPAHERATLSASVTFAHVRSPLRGALTEARRLLDDVAKDENQRDSLAVGVFKRSGPLCTWASTWTRPGPNGTPVAAVEAIEAFARRLTSDDAEVGLSTTLLHRLHNAIGVLCGWPQWRPGTWAPLVPGLDVQAFIAAEVVRTRIEHDLDPETLAALSADTAALLARAQAVPLAPPAPVELGVDALLLARFLATGGREEDHS